MAGRGSILRRLTLLLAAVLGAGASRPAAPRDAKPPLRQYDSPYYVIYTDLEPNLVREAYARLTAMAEEYHERTKGFAGAIRSKRPFYLFRDEEDYLKAGGPPGSAGVYTGDRLMALASPEMRGRVWHTVQHEGFHQFAINVISGRLPVWVNEGLAEYFGEGVWTGDGMVTGVIPPARLKRLRQLIRDRALLPFAEMLDMDGKEWNGALSSRNYDQAWSMVHFLVSADGGRYCQALVDFINDIARGGAVKASFQGRFGRDEKAFQSRYEQWWTFLGEEDSSDVNAQAAAATLTSFLARAEFLKMKFADAAEFLAAVRQGKIAVEGEKHPQLWLPASLGLEALKRLPAGGQCALEEEPSGRLVLKTPGGAVFTGTFTLAGDQRPKVRVEVQKPKPPASATGTPATR